MRYVYTSYIYIVAEVLAVDKHGRSRHLTTTDKGGGGYTDSIDMYEICISYIYRL